MSIAKLKPYRVVFLGMEGVFSAIPFQALIKHGANIVGTVLPRPTKDQLGPKWLPRTKRIDSELPILNKRAPKTLRTLAGDKGIPVLSVGDLSEEQTVLAFRELNPELVVTACFPRLLPKNWLEIPEYGCLNLHPSLLPAYRGPSPLFWQFRNGEKNTGVTLHFMDAVMDAGDIVGQKRVVFEEGITAAETDRLTAEVGAKLILEALSRTEIPRAPQPEEGVSYQPRPTELDRTISADWPVLQAYNFFRGANGWAPFWIEMSENQYVQVSQVLAYELNGEQDVGIVEEEGVISVQMKDGLLKVR
jgi:methionyl-tRNA formyltransferase